jgi:DNA-binding response OmpR family regulator
MPVLPHILIAESDSSLCALLTRMVARTYTATSITVVNDGVAALSVFETRSVDLLITTHRLPGLSGIDVVRALRTQRVNIPILMISSDPIEAAALQAGATRFLRKPFTFTVICNIVRELLAP